MSLVRHVAAGTGGAFWAVGDTYTMKAEAAQTGGLYGLIEASVPPGGGPPPHTHTREDEAFYLLDGELEFHAEERTIRAVAGDFVYLPRGIQHWFGNPGESVARALMILTPGGMESFFTEIGTPVRAGELAPAMAPEEFGKIAAVAASYGSIVPPPDHG